MENRPWPEEMPELPDIVSLTGRWVDAASLRPGDVVQLVNGQQIPVDAVTSIPFADKVFNLEVKEIHTYAVGKIGILVHNNNCPLKGETSGNVPPVNPHLAGQTPLAGTRVTGGARAARLEVELVQKTGKGTANWTAEEIAYIQKNGRLPPGTVGHHINSVVPNEAWAGDPRNIKFVRGQADNLAEHGGKFQNHTTGPLIDRQAMIDAAPGGG